MEHWNIYPEVYCSTAHLLIQYRQLANCTFISNTLISCITHNDFYVCTVYSGKLWQWKTLANGQNNKLAKKLWRISEIMSQQVKLWQFQRDRVCSMQANKLCKFTVTLTACHVDIVPSCSVNRFGSGKDVTLI